MNHEYEAVFFIMIFCSSVLMLKGQNTQNEWPVFREREISQKYTSGTSSSLPFYGACDQGARTKITPVK